MPAIQEILLNTIEEKRPLALLLGVDGFGRGGDWLGFSELLDRLAGAGSGQILWFGGRPEMNAEDADYFSDMEGRGRILVEPMRLPTVIAHLRFYGWLGDAMPLESEDAAELSDKDALDQEPDHDWTARFFDGVKDVSSSEMRSIWARLLPGEVESPGRTSLRTLDILRNMTQRMNKVGVNCSDWKTRWRSQMDVFDTETASLSSPANEG